MINDIDYLNAVYDIGVFLRVRKKLKPQQIQKILYEINVIVERELEKL